MTPHAITRPEWDNSKNIFKFLNSVFPSVNYSLTLDSVPSVYLSKFFLYGSPMTDSSSPFRWTPHMIPLLTIPSKLVTLFMNDLVNHCFQSMLPPYKWREGAIKSVKLENDAMKVCIAQGVISGVMNKTTDGSKVGIFVNFFLKDDQGFH